MRGTSGLESLLLIDTCGDRGSVALFRGESLVEERFLPERAASSALIGAVGQILRSATLPLRELTGLGVVSGPGSFTGVRVALAVVKGLSESTGLPVGAVSRLSVLCEAGQIEHGMGILRAGRDEVYVREVEQGRPAREFMVGVDAIPALVAAKVAIYAEGAVSDLLRTAAAARCIEISARHAHGSVRRALAEGGCNVATLDANYIRNEQTIYRQRRVGA